MRSEAFEWFGVVVFAVVILGAAGMGIYNQGVRNDQIADCEKNLARNESCVLIAVPKED